MSDQDDYQHALPPIPQHVREVMQARRAKQQAKLFEFMQESDFHVDHRLIFGLRVGDVKIERHCRVRPGFVFASPDEAMAELIHDVTESLPALAKALAKMLEQES